MRESTFSNQPFTPTAAARAPVAVALIVLISALLPFNVLASAGDLDRSFGIGGKVTTVFPPSCCDRITSLARQADGKVIAGVLNPLGFAVVRYNDDGGLDLTFASGGIAVTALEIGTASAVAVQSDGKIIAAGAAHNPNPAAFDFTLVRYNRNGSVDKSFGSKGIVSTNFGIFDRILDIALQSDAKIVAVGDASVGNGFDTDCAVARYNKDGSLDGSFGDGGILTTDFATLDSFFEVLIQPDGKILACGSATATFIQSADFILARYNSDGTLDQTFGSGGKVVTDFFGSADTAFALALQSDGKCVAAGTATEAGTTNQHFALARYSSDGNLDGTFGSNGKTVTAFGIIDTVHALVIQADNKLIAGGIAGTRTPGTSDFADFDFALARYNFDGSLDSTFGVDGKVVTDFVGGSDEAYALLLQPNGKLIAGGKAASAIVSNLALARYETGIPGPRILGATVQGKKLLVFGENIEDGAVILMDDAQQKTSNDEDNPTTILIGKKAGKRIEPGQTVKLQVRNSDGALSAAFPFKRPN